MDKDIAVSNNKLSAGLAYFRELLDMIKFEHTVFALPFAFIATLAATEGRTPWRSYFWVLMAMVGARTLAMTFNRVADADLDSENPRTLNRALPAGRVKLWMAWVMIGLSAGLFGFAAVTLGPLTAELAPYAFAVLLGYSVAKRFTAWSHAILGLALSCAPLGAWAAIAGKIETPAFWLSLGVLTWTTGFDILYALQDREFDIKKGLHSIPVELGVHQALIISRACHLLAAAAWAMFLAEMRATLLPWVSLAIVAGILFREQWVVRNGNLDRLDHAFFTLNSLVGPILFLGFFAHWIRFRGVI
ncbi:MAG: putative 4-hydroxybenzoate polyprenyltransferase [Holophagales bacterium]|nr:putative 4-hydroxybenzoate polyprenyltransferase [Holophagales bacterium]